MTDPRCEADWERLNRAQAGSDFTVVDGPLRRTIAFEVGYDHRDFDCGHGVHGMGLRFVLAGPAGAVQWLVWLPAWYPGNVQLVTGVPNGEPYSVVPAIPGGFPSEVMPVDLGYHSPTPQYDDHVARDCDYLPEGYCYYDGSGLNAGPVLEAFLAHGPMAVWATLARYYAQVYDDAES